MLFRHGFDKFLLLYMGVPAIAFVVLGAFLSKLVQSYYLELILSLFLMVLSVVFLIKKEFKLRPNKSNAFFSGSLSGLMAGLVGTGGAIRGMALTVYSLPAAVFISTSAFIDLGIDFSRSIVYASNGYVHRHDLYLIPFLVGISFLGTYLGKLFLSHSTEGAFKKITLVLIFITGIFTLSRLLFFQ